MLKVASRLHPLEPPGPPFEVAVGVSFAEIVQIAVPNAPPVIVEALHVRCNGQLVPAHMMRARPKLGTVVEVVAVPRGGEAALATVLSVAVIALAVGTGGAAVGLLGLAAGSLSASIVGGLVTAAVGTVGTLAVNALVPPATPGLGGSTPVGSLATLTGATNQLRLGAPVPIPFGRRRITPQLGATPFNEGSGKNSFLRVIALWGYGQCQISEERIGQTSLDEFTVNKQFLSGSDPDAFSTATLYPSDVFADAVNIEVTKSGGFVQRTTQPNTTEIAVYISFQQGLIRFGKDSGDADSTNVTYRIEYRETGTTGAWIKFTGADILVEKKSADPFRQVHNQDVSSGQYDVRVSRITNDANEDRFRNSFLFQQIQSFNTDVRPVNVKGASFTALRVKASERLSGQLEDYSALLETVAPDWDIDTQTWITRATRNPAAMFRRALQGAHLRNPLPDSRINLTELQSWSEYCESKGYFCDLYVDFDSSVGEILSLIASAGLASWASPGGVYTVIVDRPKPVISQMWTPRNIKSFTATKTFGRPVHALRGKFQNEDVDYLDDEVIVYAPGFDEETAREIDDLELTAITNQDQAWSITQFRLAEKLFRSEMFSISVGADWLTATRGSRVRLGEESFLIGAGGGRIKSLILSEDEINIEAIQLDSSVLLDAGIHYGIQVRLSSGEINRYDIVTAVGDGDTFSLSAPTFVADGPEVGNLAWIGAVNIEVRDCLVKSITPGANETASITLIPYAPEIFDLADGIPTNIPSFITPIAGTVVPAIQSINSDETTAVRQPDGSITVRAIVSLFEVGSRPITLISGIEARYRLSGFDNPWRLFSSRADEDLIILRDLESGTTIEAQARYVYRSGAPGDWSASFFHDVRSITFPPPDLLSLFQDEEFIRWTIASIPDLLGFRVREAQSASTTWENATPAHDGIIGDQFYDVEGLGEDTTHVLVKAVSIGDLESDNALLTEIDRSTIDDRYEAFRARVTERNSGIFAPFSGTITGGANVNLGSESVPDWQVQANESGLFIPDGNAPFIADPDEVWIQSNFDRTILEYEYFVPSTVRAGYRLRLDIVASGEFLVEYQYVDDTIQALSLADDFPALTDAFPPLWAPFPSSVSGTTGRPFRAWRGSVRAFPGQAILFRITGRGGQARFTLDKFHVVVDAPELREVLLGVDVPASGLFQPAFTKNFGGVVAAIATLAQTQDDDAVTVRSTASQYISPISGETISVPALSAWNNLGNRVAARATSILLVGFG